MLGSGDNSVSEVHKIRREVVYLILAGIFLGSLTMLNILGISRFIDLSFDVLGLRVPFIVAVGVLAYPITFLCTDLISELYGRRRANLVVWVGLLLNIWVLFVLWLGGSLPPTDGLIFDGANGYNALPPLPDLDNYQSSDWAFFRIRQLTFGAVTASMIAYLTAQFVDIRVFHFLKKLTKGKHLWLRNNGSTLISQFIDSFAVITITHYYAHALPIVVGEPIIGQLSVFILSAYVFKLIAALADTIPFYLGTKYLRIYLGIEADQTEIE
ncbi:MAG: queuosine precursor transporter [Flavobacteriales bacterium]|nr:queuosine precursor transporter [Flavobacteriales bacterium]